MKRIDCESDNDRRFFSMRRALWKQLNEQVPYDFPINGLGFWPLYDIFHNIRDSFRQLEEEDS